MSTLESADDLRTFLFVAQTGRLSHAARLLGIDHTTVGRRIASLERQAGARLFNRTRGNWSLTADGERLLEPAERIEAAMTTAREAAAGGEPAALTGSVRILATDGFGSFILAPALAELTTQHPGLVVELITETQHLASATVRDFDIAVTLDQPSSAGLVHRRLAAYTLQLFATPEYLAARPPLNSVADLEQHTLVWYVDRMLSMEPLRVLHEVRARPADIQSMNIVAHWQAAAAGVCIAPLPTYIGARDPRLVEVLPEFRIQRTYWVSARREHANGARVRTLVAFLDRIVAERADDLMPRSSEI